MLTFSHGNRIEALAERLTINLSEQPLKDPLEPEIMVVQNHGMARWLSLYMAKQEGIAANLAFEFPSGYIWSLLRVMDPGIPEILPSDREPMTWSLMEVLTRAIDDPGFELLKRYVQADSPEGKAYRSWKLCSRIADVFDQYLVYRPDLLLKWEQGKFRTGEPSEQWQAGLWSRLITYWKNRHRNPAYLHRAPLQQKLTEAIGSGELNREELPSRISVFGVSTMPPAFIRILIKLAKLTDVHFYWLSPVKPKEMATSEHPLLLSLGKEGREFLDIFHGFVEEEVEVAQHFEEAELYLAGNRNHLLDILQADILDAGCQIPDTGYRMPDAGIQIHSCHSPLREVEVLKDRLLALFEQNENLDPNDVLIMTPDIETYAPFIDSVFGAHEDKLPDTPYTIAGRSVRASHPAAGTFLKILEILESRFKVTDMLDLLDSPAIKFRFSLSDNDINRVERWTKDNRIRWGIDGEFKKRENLPGNDSFTWKAGLARMMLGYAVKSEDELFNGIYPYDEIEDTENAALLGRVAAFLHELFDLHQMVQESGTLTGWCGVLQKILDTFIPGQQDFYRSYTQIREQVEKLRKETETAGSEVSVPFRVVRSHLAGRLEEPATRSGFAGQGVTFSALAPMRSIPFKVIGMIGMNDGAFPRTKIPVEFDLMGKKPRAGDRSRKNDDRYLFLENLISARHCFYMSYVGRSNREGGEYPPSVVVRELIDFIDEHYGIKMNKLVTRHRLQAFSPAYFNNKKEKLFSYFTGQLAVSRQLVSGKEQRRKFLEEPLPPPGEEWKNVPIGELIAFFQHPARYLLQNRMGIFLGEQATDEDREPFVLKGLEGYWLGQELLERLVNGKSPEEYYSIAEAVGFLPGGWTGEEAFMQKTQEVKQFGRYLQNYLRQKKLDPIEADIETGDFSITGRLDQIYAEAQFIYRFGRKRTKDLIELWIRHLIFQEIKPEGHPGVSLLLTRDRNAPAGICRLRPVPNAREILYRMMKWYWQGLCDRFYFFPESSRAYAHERINRNNNHDKGIRAASYHWKDQYEKFIREGDNPYNKLLFDLDNTLNTNEFTELSMQFFNPFFEILNQEESN